MNIVDSPYFLLVDGIFQSSFKLSDSFNHFTKFEVFFELQGLWEINRFLIESTN